MKFVSERIKQIRKKKGISQERLVQDLAISGYRMSRNTLNTWEQGKNNPSISGLIALVKYFNVSIEYFFNQK
jgi:transcriptional regulator with XRE-family HTH domain